MPTPFTPEMSRRSVRERRYPATGFLSRCTPFHGIPIHYPLRTQVRMKLKFSKLGTAWEIFQTFFALLVSAAYVVQTYMPLDGRVPTFDAVAMVVFSADYFLNLYCCENRWQFITSVNGIMDALTIFPALVDQIDDGHSKSLPFIRFVRVMRMLRLIRVVRVAGSQTVSAVQKQVYTIILLTTCLIFVAAGIFHAVESNDGAQPHLTFGEALYFIVVTIATVGYGDIVPVTSAGRAVALGVIVVSFTVIPTEISRLTHLMALQSHFRTTYHPLVGKPHVLVVGHVMEPRCLLNFFREFYHPDRALGSMTSFAGPAGTQHEVDPSVVELPCVIVGPKEPTEEIINLLDHPVLQNRVTYIKGSVMSEEDMCRVGADAARACFVLASKAAANTKQTDAETVMRLLAIRNYNPDLPVYTQIVSPVYLDYISGVDADQLLCLDKIKISLLAKSCLCPGLVTLISNLFRSTTLVNHQILTNWEQDYAEGMALEVYATTLPSVFHGLTFSQACELLYNISYGEVILLAKTVPQLRRQCSWMHHVDRPAQMLSNPGSSVIMHSGQLVYVMSESKKLTLTTSISNELKAWLAKGNVLPARKSKPNLVPKRTEMDAMLIEEAVYPSTDDTIRNHIIVVSDLDVTSTVSFAQMLRLERHVPGSSDYYPIIFLSWSSAKRAVATCRELREFDDIFVMLATGDSKRELLRANILDASRCVVLADKANIQDIDGEAVDSQTIFHYLAVLSIQAEYGMDTTSGLMPMVELNMPRTMQILDSTLKKRTATSYHDIKRKLGKANVVKNMYMRGADNIISLDQQVKLSKRINSKRTLIKRELESTRRHYFDVRRSALLPFFAAGYGFADDIFDNMLCQSFFTPGLIRLIYELLFSENGRPAALSGNDKALSSCTASSIAQIPVPLKFVQRTFGDLFLHLLSTKEIVAIGLYRGTDTPFQLPYVATGPDSDTILVDDDLVFVLAHPAALDCNNSDRWRQQEKTSHNQVNFYERQAINTPSTAGDPRLPPLAISSKTTALFRGNVNK
ncbi:Voltage-gated Ion Channel (VIC) Superfamily [Phytophthora infestans T30-4]|uniref:BK channel n=1 Tax=Phytophthora infestans (strain T30-4) TaxID=403677 RepID=D0N4C8_PHYIT|nr:Voltage-gated Ion Channel (VIC) Superfamily [Phytophthora infestans T30-4]EEY69736.1 Voltage-gated Ion Channel (VIC) Superfamily [Phytophthora infestans T30-4]|eukprot:XP_002998383.1 Voltage-gated Ion Channel (VIC) Superfamily [Phytophthora infestans T30-4]